MGILKKFKHGSAEDAEDAEGVFFVWRATLFWLRAEFKVQLIIKSRAVARLCLILYL
jgi:hypothetical protein